MIYSPEYEDDYRCCGLPDDRSSLRIIRLRRRCPCIAPPPSKRPAMPARLDPIRHASSGTEPVKVFDNLYFVGAKVHGGWAVSSMR